MQKPPIVIPHRLQTTLLQGIEEYQVIHISAGTGWGKTTAVRKLLEKQNANYIPLRARALPGGFPRSRLIVIDDFQELYSSCSERRFVEILRKAPPSQRFVLLSRGPLPELLCFYEGAGSLLRLGADGLALDMDCLARLVHFYQAPSSASDLQRLLQVTAGNPVAAKFLLLSLARGQPFRRRAVEEMEEKMGGYIDEAVFRHLEPNARRALLNSAFFDGFDLGLMETLTGDRECQRTLERLRQTTGLLQRDRETWSLAGDVFTRPFLRRKAAEEYAPEQIRDLHLSGGRWYEGKGERKNALSHYRQAGSREDIVRVLAQSARQRPGDGAYHDLRDEYELLTEEEIKRSPDLICAMSMLRSMSFDVEGAETWYSILKARVEDPSRDGDGRRRERGLLAYLDIALPHRGSAKLTETLPAVWELQEAGELVLPEIPVTGGLPSVLRGGKDLSRWVPHAQELYNTIRGPAEAALGRSGVGLGEIALTESRLEKGEDVSGRVLSLVALQKEIRDRGTPEMEFVLAALMARALYASGALEKAAALLRDFRAEMEKAGGERLLPNIDAMLCRLSLMGDGGDANVWFAEEAPDERRFDVTERYRYLTKVRCYIQRKEYLLALMLLGRMLLDSEQYDRSLDRLESLLLTAICRFRMDKEDWQTYFSQALELGARFGYVAVFAREGAALLPLMKRYDPIQVEPDYWKQILTSTVTQSGHYGRYLLPLEAPADRLTRAENMVLILISQNRSNEEIADLLGIKVPTVKTHLRNLFQKLNVTSRAEARDAAQRLHML